MPHDVEQLRAQVRQRFARIARVPEQERKLPVGSSSARKLGYDPDEIDRLPASATESFAGVGNPITLGRILPGQTVLDLGCGAGLDSFLAARRVGPAGRVVGVDMTAEMLEKARANARLLGADNVEFRLGSVEDLPVADGLADVVISNGVFNLCPDKEKALAEAFRALRRQGRLLMADILLESHVTMEEVARVGTWSD